MCRLIPQLSRSVGAIPRKIVSDVLESKVARVLLARDVKNEICGILTLAVFPLITGARAVIEDFVVDESMRGRGVGRMLMREAMRMAKESGAEAINLTSHPSRIAANHLYRSLGFEPRETNAYKYGCGA